MDRLPGEEREGRGHWGWEAQAKAEKQIDKGVCLSREPGGDAEPGGSKKAGRKSPSRSGQDLSACSGAELCQEGQGGSLIEILPSKGGSRTCLPSRQIHLFLLDPPPTPHIPSST